LTCHNCRKDHPWLLFGYYCLPCWRKAPSVAELVRATRDYLHPVLTKAEAGSQASLKGWATRRAAALP
jgi:hypothetical protein